MLVRTFLIKLMVLSIFSINANAFLCKKSLRQDIKMDDEWYQKEENRLEKEDILLEEYSNYISKEVKPLVAGSYFCEKGEVCDPIRNCQINRKIKNVFEVEYKMKIDSGINILKSYCTVIGKCVGYNDFTHSSKVTASEDRLIDIKKDNAVFYHYFYSANSNNYEPPFNITNFHTGSELYLNDEPHFSSDDEVIIEVRSVAKQVENKNLPIGFNINIYEINKFGEYENIEPMEIDPQDSSKVLSTFLSRNPNCGETPHFYAWKGEREVILSMLPISQANESRKVILFYDKKLKKWGCKEDILPKAECESHLPNSTKFSSNLSEEQVIKCHTGINEENRKALESESAQQ